VKKVLATLVLVLVALQIRFWGGAGGVAEIRRLEAGIEAQTAENATLDQRNQGLKDEVSDLRTGLDAIEERARTELGLIRKGETFFLMVEDLPEEVQDREDILAPAVEPGTEPAPALEPGAEPGIFTSLETAVLANPTVEPVPVTPVEPAPEETVEEEPAVNPYLELFREDGAGDSER